MFARGHAAVSALVGRVRQRKLLGKRHTSRSVMAETPNLVLPQAAMSRAKLAYQLGLVAAPFNACRPMASAQFTLARRRNIQLRATLHGLVF